MAMPVAMDNLQQQQQENQHQQQEQKQQQQHKTTEEAPLSSILHGGDINSKSPGDNLQQNGNILNCAVDKDFSPSEGSSSSPPSSPSPPNPQETSTPPGSVSEQFRRKQVSPTSPTVNKFLETAFVASDGGKGSLRGKGSKCNGVLKMKSGDGGQTRSRLESEFAIEACSWPSLRDSQKPKALNIANAQDSYCIVFPSPTSKGYPAQVSLPQTVKQVGASFQGVKSNTFHKHGTKGKPTFVSSENRHAPLWIPVNENRTKNYGRGAPQRPGYGAGPADCMMIFPSTAQGFGRGRGHPTWHNQNRGPLQPHHQQVSPRGVARPLNPVLSPIPSQFNIPVYYETRPYFKSRTTPCEPPGGIHNYQKLLTKVMVQRQIEYYFSVENLCKDMYLRSKMDDEGFVSVIVIATFNRVKSLTSSPLLILEALEKSAIVEVKDEKMRRANDWERWLLPKPLVSNSSQGSNEMNKKGFTQIGEHDESSGITSNTVVDNGGSIKVSNSTTEDNNKGLESGEQNILKNIVEIDSRDGYNEEATDIPKSKINDIEGLEDGEQDKSSGDTSKPKVDSVSRLIEEKFTSFGIEDRETGETHKPSESVKFVKGSNGEPGYSTNNLKDDLNWNCFIKSCPSDGQGDISHVNDRYIKEDQGLSCISNSHSNQDNEADLSQRTLIAANRSQQLGSCIAVL